MASGPLVFIHPVLDDGGGGGGGAVAQHSSPPGSSPSLKPSEVGGGGGDYFYWNTASTTTTSHQSPSRSQHHQTQHQEQQRQPSTHDTASSTWELSVNHLLAADHWINSPRGHSDPNLQEKTSGCFSTELPFNNYVYDSPVGSPSAICAPSCTPTPTSAGTTTIASQRGGSDWMISWQQQRLSAHNHRHHHHLTAHPQVQQQQGLNNEDDFFNTASSYQNFAGLGSTATTIVNNRGGFFPNPTSHPSLPPEPQLQPSGVVGSQMSKTIVSSRVLNSSCGNPFERVEEFPLQKQASSHTQGIGRESDVEAGVVPPSATSCLPKNGGGGGNGSPSSSTGGGGGGNRVYQSANSIQSSTTLFSKRGAGMMPPLNRRSSATECSNKPLRPSSDTNVISLTDNPGAPMLKMDSTLSLDTDSRTRPCCFCWCCCCSCSCVRVRPPIESGKRSTHSNEEPHRTETQLLETRHSAYLLSLQPSFKILTKYLERNGSLVRTSYEEVLSWSESFDNLMRCFTSADGTVGQKAFREFLRSEYSEENILFWLACEELKSETNAETVEEKARLIYEDYISILSPKEVSLDSRVREMINTNMTQPTPHTFDEAQLQIYTLMQRDSYPRFLNSRIYKDLLTMTKGENS